MKISDKASIAHQIDIIIKELPGVRLTSEHIGYRYIIPTQYGDLLIHNDLNRDELGSSVYSIFCRFVEGKEIYPSNSYLRGTHTNKYNLDLFFDDPDIIEKAKHHLTIT